MLGVGNKFIRFHLQVKLTLKKNSNLIKKGLLKIFAKICLMSCVLAYACVGVRGFVFPATELLLNIFYLIFIKFFQLALKYRLVWGLLVRKCYKKYWEAFACKEMKMWRSIFIIFFCILFNLICFILFYFIPLYFILVLFILLYF